MDDMTDSVKFLHSSDLQIGMTRWFLSAEAQARFDDDRIRVRVTVQNTGARKGIEIVQAYVEYPGSIPRAKRALKAFATVELEAGASKPVDLEIAIDDLRYYDTVSGKFDLEEGEHRIRIAAHAGETDVPSIAVNLP